MAVPSLPNTWRITYAWQQGTPSQIAEVVIHVTAPTLADPLLVAGEAASAWMVASGLCTRSVPTLFGTSITVQPYDGSSAPTVTTPGSWAGQAMTGIGSAVPSNVAMVITKRTLLSGRAYRGRIFLPAVATSMLDVGAVQWTNTAVTNTSAAAMTTLTKLKGGPTITDMVVYSHVHNTKASVSSLIARQWLGTQRRRTTLHSP